MDFFTKQNLGGKLIIVGGALAVLSLFMPWADLGFVSASGFQQDGYFFLLPMIYPFYKAVRFQSFNKIAGYILTVLALIAGIGFAMSKQVDMMGTAVNGAGAGLYLFIITAVLMLFGVFNYQPVNSDDAQE